MYPVIAYNIGDHKLVIQNSLGDGHQYLFNLPDEESFINFSQFKSFEDIGYLNDTLKLDNESNFVYLSLDKNRIFISINILFVDIFF